MAPRSKPIRPRPDSDEIRAAIRSFALGLPEAHEDFPWGESVAKVGKKVFVFMGMADAPSDPTAPVSFSVKLPVSAPEALSYPWASPTGYGLGKSGWVSVSCPPAEVPEVELFTDWIEESYRSIAPKKLVARLDD